MIELLDEPNGDKVIGVCKELNRLECTISVYTGNNDESDAMPEIQLQ